MLIPRFSLRMLFGLLTGSSLFFLVLAAAWRGQAWAWGATAAVGAMLLVVGMQALLYFVARSLGVAGLVREPSAGEELK